LKIPLLRALNIPFKKEVLPGRVKCCGTEAEIVVASWLPKDKKTNYMWHGRGISGGLWSPDFPRSVDGPLKEYFVLYLYTLRQKSVISIFLKY